MKTTRRLSAALLAATLAFGVAACSDPESTATPGTETTQTAADPVDPSSPEVEESPEGSDPSTPKPTAKAELGEDGFDVCVNAKGTFSGPAAKTFGAQRVKDAYCDLVEMELEYSFTSLMTQTENFRPEQFYSITEFMSADAKASWEKSVQAAVADPEDYEAQANVLSLVYYNMAYAPDGYEFSSKPPFVFDRTWSDGEAWVDRETGEDRLAIRFTLSADLNMLRNGKPVTYPVEKDLVFWLIPSGNPEQPFLIDGWQTPEGLSYGKIKPRA